MTILFFHRWVGLHDGGTETHIKEIANFLVRKGHDVSILTTGGELLKNNIHKKIKIYRLRKMPGESEFSYSVYDPRLYFYTGFYMFRSFLRLAHLYAVGKRFDIISVHFPTEAKVACLVRALFGTPYLFVMEGYTDWEAREAKKADLSMASSQHEVDECCKNHGFKPILKPHGVDLKRFNPLVDGYSIRRKYLKGHENLILTVCRLEPRKDIPTLLKAAKILLQERKDIKFLIVGEGVSQEMLRAMAKEMGIDEHVYFVGRVSDEDLPRYYQASDIFVLPTLYEGFGIVYLEAMASGTPIITTTVGAAPEVIEDDGILIPPKKPKIMAEKIKWLLDNSSLRKKYGYAGLVKAQKLYDREKLLGIFEKSAEEFLKAGILPSGRNLTGM